MTDDTRAVPSHTSPLLCTYGEDIEAALIPVLAHRESQNDSVSPPRISLTSAPLTAASAMERRGDPSSRSRSDDPTLCCWEYTLSTDDSM